MMREETKNRKPFLSLPLKVILSFVLFFLVAFVFVYFFRVEIAWLPNEKILKTELKQTLEGAAAAVDTGMLLDLAADGTPNADGFSDDPRYLALLDTLDTVHQIEPDAWPYLYIAGDHPDEIYFVVDLISIYEPEHAAGFMEPYQSESGFILLGLEELTFRQVDAPLVEWLREQADQARWSWLQRFLTWTAEKLAGSALFPGRDIGSYQDKFGRWVSGYMPLLNASGEKVAGIGIDFNADQVLAEYQHTHQQVMQELLFSIIPLALFLFFLLRTFVGPVNQLTRIAAKIKSGEKPSFQGFRQVRWVHLTDEIDLLSEVLQEMVETISERERLYQAVISTQREIIVRVSKDGRFIFWNAAYEQLWGDYDVHDLVGIADTGIHPDDRQAAVEFITREVMTIDSEEMVRSKELRIYDIYNRLRWFLWTVTGIFDDEGNLVEYQAVAQDITELKEVQQKLEKANRRLQEISHDLIAAGEQERNDIAREVHDDVLNYLSELMLNLEGDVPAEMVIETYQMLAERLRQTVYNLRPPMLVYGLYYGLQDYAENFASRVAGQIEIDFDLEDRGSDYPKEINTHLFRIIQQACENAVEHADASRISISGHLEPHKAVLYVEDDGCGFDWDDETYIDRAVTHDHFGLAGMLERGLITGADVTISSTEGEGTRIEVHWVAEKVFIAG